MKLNQLRPAKNSNKPSVRVGRGIGSGCGKTCGRGVKGQYARNSVRPGFEGGQMPLYRRIPKSGFSSWMKLYRAEITLDDLNRIDADVITIDVLRQLKFINKSARFVKVIATGKLNKAIKLHGIKTSAGAQQAIEAAGGKVEHVNEE